MSRLFVPVKTLFRLNPIEQDNDSAYNNMSFGRGAAPPMQHPFEDPFFRDPFGMMNNMMGNMSNMMGGMFNDPFFQGGPFQQQQQQVPPRRRLPRAVVEEVHADHPVTGSSEPIVEEPDEEGGYQQAGPGWQQQQSGTGWQQQQQQQFPSMVPFGAFGSNLGGGGGPVYAYSSSSVMSNQNGVTYQKSTTARMGPGGTKEVQSTERDGRTGKESITVSRALGDRARTVTRTRDASGAEDSQDLLRGLSQEEANRFDQEWLQQAERNLLPGRAALGAAPSRRSYAPMQQQQQLQLPSSTGVGRQPNYPSAGYQNEYLGRSRTLGRQV